MPHISRADFLRGTAGATALGLTAMPHFALAADECRQVVVTTWGGDYDRFLKQFVEPPLVAKGVQVLPDITQEPQRMTKLLAERSLKKGSLDVVSFSDASMFQMHEDGVLSALDVAKLPNAKYILKQFANSYSVPHIFSAQVIVYTPDHIKGAPDSYAAFWDSKYKGRVGIQRTEWVNWLQLAAQLGGGSPSNYEPGKKLLMDLKKNQPRIYPTQETLAAGIASGDVWLTPDWRARAYMWAKGGLNVESSVPKEGALPVVYRAGYAKNAPDEPCCLEYLDAMLDAKAQVEFATNMGYVPTVSNAKLPEDLERRIGFSEEQRAHFYPQDFRYIAKNNSQWLQWWNQEFLA